MNTTRKTVAAFVLCLLLAGPAALNAQDQSAAGTQEEQLQTKRSDVLDIQKLTEMLDLKDHQIQFLKEIQEEMQERIDSEEEALRERDPEMLAQLKRDMKQEAMERVRGVLNPEQLVIYEKNLAKEKQRRVSEDHPQDGTSPETHPGDPDKTQ